MPHKKSFGVQVWPLLSIIKSILARFELFFSPVLLLIIFFADTFHSSQTQQLIDLSVNVSRPLRVLDIGANIGW